ncbi:hypothetical protein AB0436_13570 [Streptomyces sp. NPDC051322]|uniref:hypothetical protein n=1 Tax=Streptomyces sp. NPDC051322 TaxID=3154645 RepID=UPI00344BB358
MSALNITAKRYIIVGAIGMTLAVSGTASADDTFDGTAQNPTASGNANGQDLEARVESGGVLTKSDNNGKGPSVGPLTPVSNWTPPPCWYAPTYTAAEFKKDQEHTWSLGSTGPEWDSKQRDHYAGGHPYKDFNMAKADKGYWWTSGVNKSFPPGWDSCKEPTFWVDKGDPAPPKAANRAVTPEILAHIAYATIRVPDTKVKLAPAGATKVNLPTWAWLDKTDFKPVSVTAYVPLTGMSATTTATPKSLKLEPGTADAETYPASGECTFVNGSIGTPYAKGDADKTPPCGVTYLRASGNNGPFKLKATITWKITWTGPGTAGGRLPDGAFGNTQDVTVDEIQAINR